jgi:hypothetical protein
LIGIEFYRELGRLAKPIVVLFVAGVLSVIGYIFAVFGLPDPPVDVEP